jgi:hypothetical protein
MKKLKDQANKKKEVMYIYDSRMTCEECRDIGYSGDNCPEIRKDVNFMNNNNYYHP